MARSPSLKALIAFETAARTGSFAAAARELSVSPAAVSQLVRTLEDQIGRQLFRRVNRGIALTEVGLEILPRLVAAFDELKGVSDQLLRNPPRARLTVSVPPSVATDWLSAKIADFLRGGGGMDVSLRGEEDPVDFDLERIDIRMSYGSFHYPAHGVEEVLTDVVIPVCAPSFLERHGPFEGTGSLIGVPKIHTDWGRASATFPSWRDMLANDPGMHGRSACQGIVANSSHAALNLALGGLGVVLGQGVYLARFLESGALVRVTDGVLRLKQPYCLTIPSRSAKKTMVRQFRDWFVKEMRAASALLVLGEK